MSDDTYRTLADRGQAAFEVRGSEFIGHAEPVESREQAEKFIEEIELEYADATHNVPAYRVRDDPLREWSSDDGEPSGSSGKPALNVLQQQDIENVVVVVTRYYGGTNLGVGGLARSYSQAVKEAVEAAGVVEAEPHERFEITVEYDDSGTVRGVLESATRGARRDERAENPRDGVEFDAEYGEQVAFEVRVPEEQADALRDRIRSATSGRAEIE
ncbi:IMPACT family protein [Halorussus halophilus]|uniref:IMPACT family protein n=1 Tax=Halorussus halophilus TaxID=2650975 RepID=UPI001301307E|nr:YigZ family protein [Halorussus halophilus]